MSNTPGKTIDLDAAQYSSASIGKLSVLAKELPGGPTLDAMERCISTTASPGNGPDPSHLHRRRAESRSLTWLLPRSNRAIPGFSAITRPAVRAIGTRPIMPGTRAAGRDLFLPGLDERTDCGITPGQRKLRHESQSYSQQRYADLLHGGNGCEKLLIRQIVEH